MHASSFSRMERRVERELGSRSYSLISVLRAHFCNDLSAYNSLPWVLPRGMSFSYPLILTVAPAVTLDHVSTICSAPSVEASIHGSLSGSRPASGEPRAPHWSISSQPRWRSVALTCRTCHAIVAQKPGDGTSRVRRPTTE